MKKILVIIAAFFVGIICGLILTHGPLNAQNEDSDSDVMSKLNDIAKNQQELMTAINSIKEDLQTIKLRITQMQ